jgi:hypothetical protein
MRRTRLVLAVTLAVGCVASFTTAFVWSHRTRVARAPLFVLASASASVSVDCTPPKPPPLPQERCPVQLPPTTLQEAIYAGDVPAVERFLTQGANPNARDATGTSRLLEALITPMPDSSRRKIVGLLFANGANADESALLGSYLAAQDSTDDAGRRRPYKCDLEIIKLLIKHGTTSDGGAVSKALEMPEPEQTTVLDLLFRAQKFPPEEIMTVLADTDDPRIVARFAKQGVQWNVPVIQPEPHTFLIEAASRGAGAIVRALLAAGAKPNLTLTEDTDEDRQLRRDILAGGGTDIGPVKVTPLGAALQHLASLAPDTAEAARASAEDTVLALLERGADPNAPERREPPIVIAAGMGSIRLVNALLARGARIDARDWLLHQSALDAALRQDHDAMAKLLQARGAKPTPPPPCDDVRSTNCTPGARP